MSLFQQRIQPAFPTEQEIADRHWMYVPYDRQTDATGPLSETLPQDAGIVFVESEEKARRRPYHKKKLALLVSNQRHFALEQAGRGVRVIYVQTIATFGEGLLQAQQKHRLPELTVMSPAERELRLDLAAATAQGLQWKQVPDTTWLSTHDDFDALFPRSSGYLMDRFYRAMRHKTGILMENSKPVGGQFSYDAENRKPYKGEIPVPLRPRFQPDAITQEVLVMIERGFPNHFGNLDGFDLPTTHAQCEQAWKFALAKMLPHFGPYEDAMSEKEPELFHSRMSSLINLSRLLPARVVHDVLTAYEQGGISLAGTEGFVRQILGWREYMRHLHRVTDGYRDINLKTTAPRKTFSLHNHAATSAPASPNALDANLPLPAAYWGVKSGWNCLDTVVKQVIQDGWSHHITRLMILSNIATLCGFSPRELTDWFWFAYIDAYDWVVESNVLGLSTYADGGMTATKPYVSGAAYIHRMSDYCAGCKYNPKKSTGESSCPITSLYWIFLERNREQLGSNMRLAMPYATLRKKTAEDMNGLRQRATTALRELTQVVDKRKY